MQSSMLVQQPISNQIYSQKHHLLKYSYYAISTYICVADLQVTRLLYQQLLYQHKLSVQQLLEY